MFEKFFLNILLPSTFIFIIIYIKNSDFSDYCYSEKAMESIIGHVPVKKEKNMPESPI